MVDEILIGLIAGLAVFFAFRREEGVLAGLIAGWLGGFGATVAFWRLDPRAGGYWLAVVALLLALNGARVLRRP